MTYFSAPRQDPDESDRQTERRSSIFHSNQSHPLDDWTDCEKRWLDEDLAAEDLASRIAEVDFTTCVAEHLGSGAVRCLTHGHVYSPDNPLYRDPASPCYVLNTLRKAPSRPSRRDQVTKHLSAKNVSRLAEVSHRAAFLDMPLALFVTISWSTLGVTTNQEVVAAWKGLQARMRSWATRRICPSTGEVAPLPLAYIWVKENGERWGLHTHLLVHVPPIAYAVFGSMLKEHLEASTGQPLVNSAHDSSEGARTLRIDRPRGVGAGPASTADVNTWAARRLAYMLKGLDPEALVMDHQAIPAIKRPFADVIGLTRLSDQGEVVGKRCGYSVFSIGDKTWTAATADLDLPDQFGRPGNWDLHTSWRDGQIARSLRAATHAASFEFGAA